MKLNKQVLKGKSVAYRTKTSTQLETELNNLKKQLNDLAKTKKENYEYYSESIKQKIALIEQELKLRESLNETTI